MIPWTVAHQAHLFLGFPKQEYWSGLPFPSPEELPYPGIKTASPALAEFFTVESPGKSHEEHITLLFVLSQIIVFSYMERKVMFNQYSFKSFFFLILYC